MISGHEMFYGYEATKGEFETIADISDPNADYSFDDFYIFRHVPTGRIYYGQDSGCSCPSPFENEHWKSPDDTSFTEVTKTTLDEFIKALDGHCGLQDEKREAENKVKELLKEARHK